ncbi:angiomotin-like [Ptychodera flava]|uniref:angiomotin-like n=1 Tax=Ptychodera flava TaxID=63121 RepID=UPI00396A306C
MKLQLKDDKSNAQLDKSQTIMEPTSTRCKKDREVVRSKTMDTAQMQPVRRRRQHKHHRSDEYPMYNKDGSRSILAQLLQSESQNGQGAPLSVNQMSKSMDNLHIYRHGSGGTPVYTTTIDLGKSLSQENITRTGRFRSEFSQTVTSRQTGDVVAGRSDSVDSKRQNSNPSTVERNIVEHERREVTNSNVTNLDDRPPPPYPGHSKLYSVLDHNKDVTGLTVDSAASQSSFEKLDCAVVTGIQPDSSSLAQQERSSSDSDGAYEDEFDHEAIANRATQMVDILSEENAALRQELECYYQKVSKLQKFEQDIQKVQKSYEQLVKSTTKREHLEKVMRSKLESEFKRTQEKNIELSGQIETLQTQLQAKESPANNDVDLLKRELRKRDAIIAQLIVQHKENLTNKERVEIELAAQRATLSEQRTHIDVLDTALSNAQANAVRLQEESQKKQVYVDRVEKLQKAVVALQNACDKREQLEKKLRLKLEKEIDMLRAQQNAVANQEHDEGVSLESPNNSHTLMVLLKERDEKIMSLEAEVTKWEQRYLEEVALKQCVDPPSPTISPKHHIPDINPDEEIQTEKMRQMEEAFAISKRCSDLETRVKALTYELNEKSNYISVLQHQSYEKDKALSSLEKLLRTSASPVGSLQNITMKSLNRGSGSQERVAAMSNSYSSLNSSNPMLMIDSSLSDSSIERNERLRELDRELAQQDSILQTLQVPPETGSSFFKI